LNKKTKIRVAGVPEHFNLPWHLAIESNQFDTLDTDVEFVEFPGGTGAMTVAMDAGKIDVALLLTEGAITNILRGHQNRIVKVYVQSPLIWGIHVAAGSAITNVENIREKVIAISRAGSGSHLIAIVDANKRGWPTDNMKFSKVNDLKGARQKLANGKVDVLLWERFTTQPLVDRGELRRVGERTPPWPGFVVSVRQEFLDQHQAKIRAMLEVINHACQALMQNPAAVDLISQRYKIKRDDAQQWFDHVRWNTNFEFPAERFANVIKYLQDVGIVEPTPGQPQELCFQL
jgi:ABC-type nitrate/sulfonate/bicarbonate transport system substrate-binding protein